MRLDFQVYVVEYTKFEPVKLLTWVYTPGASLGRMAYEYCMDNLRNMGFLVDGLAFDPNLVKSLSMQLEEFKL